MQLISHAELMLSYHGSGYLPFYAGRLFIKSCITIDNYLTVVYFMCR